MSKTKIEVDLKETPYTSGGPIATGILMGLGKLKNAADTITSIKLTDTESTSPLFGFGLRFRIVIEIPLLFPNKTIVTDDYHGSKIDPSLIASFIESRWKIAIYNEIAELKKTTEELEKIVSEI